MIRVLVVDDSIVFRSQITACLKDVAGVEVVGAAPNGRIAIQKIEQQTIDLIILDMEMPELDGLGTLREIREKGIKVKCLVFSSQTTRGAEKALEALRLGAHDIIAKPVGDAFNFESAQIGIREMLLPKVQQFLDTPSKEVKAHSLSKPAEVSLEKTTRKDLDLFFPQICVIASSTGGPNALEEIFSHIKGQTSKPILIVQHMPPVFTQILAKRLKDVSGLDVQEAKQGEVVAGGVVRICPGDFHLRLVRDSEGRVVIDLGQDALRNSVRPAADFLFESAADLYSNKCLAVVLTGMGEDGFVGSRKVRAKGGAVVIQDKKSCVVFGMPGAIFAANDFDRQSELLDIAALIARTML